MSFGPLLTVKASTGRKVIAPYVYASADVVLWPPDIDIDVGAGLKDVADEITDADFNTELTFGPLQDPKIEASLSAYFKPQIKLTAAPLLSFDVPMKIGFTLGAEVGSPLEPVDEEDLKKLILVLGDCSTCHILGVGLDGYMESDEFKVTIFEPVDRLKKVQPIELFDFKLVQNIAKACFVKQFGDHTITCGDDGCCDGTGYQCANRTPASVLDLHSASTPSNPTGSPTSSPALDTF